MRPGQQSANHRLCSDGPYAAEVLRRLYSNEVAARPRSAATDRRAVCDRGRYPWPDSQTPKAGPSATQPSIGRGDARLVDGTPRPLVRPVNVGTGDPLRAQSLEGPDPLPRRWPLRVGHK